MRELGRGGMGVVILARDTVLDVAVALKLIPETVVRDTEGIIDLKKEVLRGMELTHPGIVRVFSFEQDAKTAVIVMEHVDGESLAQKKAQRPHRCFDCAEVLPWLEQLCAALDYAHHEARIAHRDLKPGNLMVTPAGRLKVADFGIASGLSETMSRISVRSDSAGTPPYMSPQQAMGERATHLDDIYSLGATIYELLTGKPPFFRGNILAQVLHEEPVSMTQRRAELGVTSGEAISPAWEKMVKACLAKAPTERPGSGAEILAMLANPERALVRSAATPPENLRLEIVPVAEPIQRVHPRPVPQVHAVREEVEVVEVKRRELNLQPLVGACSSVVHGSAAAIGAVLKPLMKLAAAIALLWGILVVSQKWSDGRAERAALAAKEAAAARLAEAEETPAVQRPPQVVYLPPPPPPEHGGGPGPRPGPHRPPPPHRR